MSSIIKGYAIVRDDHLAADRPDAARWGYTLEKLEAGVLASYNNDRDLGGMAYGGPSCGVHCASVVRAPEYPPGTPAKNSDPAEMRIAERIAKGLKP